MLSEHEIITLVSGTKNSFEQLITVITTLNYLFLDQLSENFGFEANGTYSIELLSFLFSFFTPNDTMLIQCTIMLHYSYL
jgi:hypothetical protein